MKKKFIFIFLALIILCIIAFFYINQILIPVKFKEIALQKTQETLNRKVSIGSVHFKIFKGIIIENIKIYQKDDNKKLFASIEEANCNIIFPTFFKNKSIVIPTLTINSPFLNLSKNQDNEWNFSDLINKKSSSSTNKFNLFIKKIIINNGRTNYTDYSSTNKYIEMIENINIKAFLSLNGAINLKLNLEIPKQLSTVLIEGKYNLLKKSASFHANISNVHPGHYASIIYPKNNLEISNGIISSAELNISYKKNKLNIEGNFSLNSAEILFDKNKKVSGDIHVKDIELSYSPKNIKASGEIKTFNSNIELNENEYLSGNITTKIHFLKFQNSELTADGNISVSNVKSNLPDIIISKGNLSVNDIKLSSNKNTTSVNGNLNIDNATISAFQKYSANGSFSSNNFQFLYTEENLQFNGPLKTLNTNINIKEENIFNGNINSDLLSLSKKKDEFNLNGSLDILNADLLIKNKNIVKGDILISDCSLTQVKNNITATANIKINESYISLDKSISTTGDISTKQITLKSTQDKINVTGHIELSKSNILLDSSPEKIKFSGAPSLKFDYSFYPQENKNTYSGLLILSNANITNLPYIDNIQEAKGNIEFEENKISSDSFSFNTIGTDLTISGKLLNFSEPSLDINFSTPDIQLHRTKLFFTDIFEKFGIQIDGNAQINGKYKGLLKDPLDADIILNADLLNSNFSSSEFKAPINSISGKIGYKADVLTWENLTATYDNTEYLLEGSLENFSRPAVTTTAISDDLNISTKIKILRKALQFSSLVGTYKDIRFDLKGDMHFSESDTDFDIRGNFIIDLNKLKNLHPNLKDKVKDINPAGVLNAEGLIQGKLNDFYNWNISLAATSPIITLYNTQFKDATIQYNQRDNYISKFNILSELYGGALSVTSTADLHKNNTRFILQTKITELDLRLFREHNKLKNEHLSGQLNTILNLAGPIDDLNEINGSGSFTISNGYLGEWSILKGLTQALLIIPEFKNLFINNASADFLISNKKVITENALLSGKTFDLRAQGWIDFDKNINFSISPDFSQFDLIKSESLKKVPTAILSQSININCSGTINSPSCKANKTPLKIIETTTDIIKDGIGELLNQILF